MCVTYMMPNECEQQVCLQLLTSVRAETVPSCKMFSITNPNQYNYEASGLFNVIVE